MGVEELYRGQLQEHARNPRHHGGVDACAHRARVDNPLCGDQIEVGVDLTDGDLKRVRFQARGCAICIASGSLMVETVEGASVERARHWGNEVSVWFGSEDESPPDDLPENLLTLSPARNYPTRWRCVLLAWEALDRALSEAGA